MAFEALQEALIKERWLPIGLRSLIANELPSLRAAAAVAEGRAPQALDERLDFLRSALGHYGDSVTRSEVAAALENACR